MRLLEYQNVYWKDNPKFFLELLDLVYKYSYNGSYVRMLKANGRKRDPNCIPPYKHLRLWIERITQKYDDQIKDFTTRVYWVLNGLIEAPRCQNEKCNALLVGKTFDATKNAQPQFCSRLCLNKSSSHTFHANTTKHRRGEEDNQYWSKIEQKKKAHKVRTGHSSNWTNNEKRQQTLKSRLEDDPDFFMKIEQKKKATKVQKGHHPNWHNEEQMVSTRYAKNGGVWETKDIVKRKIARSYEKYGYASPNQSPIVKQHKKDGCMKKYGVDSYSKTKMYHKQMQAIDEQRKQKEHFTKKRNGTFSVSKPEDRVYSFLCSKFGEDDIERQYRSNVYPFSCDFYVKSLDLYIECNFSWTHGKHWFDASSEEDQKTLQKWRSKKTQYYDNAIATWTVRDVKKREIALKNNLKYIALWKEDYEQLESELRAFKR